MGKNAREVLPTRSFAPNLEVTKNDTRTGDEAEKEMKAASDALIELANHPGWVVLKKWIQSNISLLEEETSKTVRAEAQNGGMDFAKTGFRFHLFDQIRGFADSEIQFVESQEKIRRLEMDTPDGDNTKYE